MKSVESRPAAPVKGLSGNCFWLPLRARQSHLLIGDQLQVGFAAFLVPLNSREGRNRLPIRLGLGRLRRLGWRTIAQDESSSIVWGMPKAAVEIGAAEEVVSLLQIAEAIMRLVPS